MANYNLSESDLKVIITQEDGTEILVREAEKMGKLLVAKRLKTNQIRAIFEEVRRIEGEWKTNPGRANRSLILLKPKMAYRAKKEGDSVKNLTDILQPAIDYVDGKKENFERFVDFFEAILAYHRAKGGYSN